MRMKHPTIITLELSLHLLDQFWEVLPCILIIIHTDHDSNVMLHEYFDIFQHTLIRIILHTLKGFYTVIRFFRTVNGYIHLICMPQILCFDYQIFIKEIRSTFLLLIAQEIARLAVMVDLPSPEMALVTATACLSFPARVNSRFMRSLA